MKKINLTLTVLIFNMLLNSCSPDEIDDKTADQEVKTKIIMGGGEGTPEDEENI